MTKIREIINKYNSEIKIDENTDWEYIFFCIKEADFNKLEKELKKLDNWISVEDELPKSTVDVLIVNADNKVDVGFYNGCWEVTIYTNDIVTHWQPLPNPPKEKKRITEERDHFADSE